MKPHTIHILATAALLAGAAPAFAWPIKDKLTGLDSIDVSAATRIAFLQADNDGPLEFCNGGGNLLNRQFPNPTSTFLPRFNSGAYSPGDTNVIYAGGHIVTGDIDGDGDVDIVRSGSLGYATDGFDKNDLRIMCAHNNGAGNFTKGWEFV